jgi:hypothetical protein
MRPDEEHPVPQGKLSSILAPWWKGTEHRIDERTLTPETGQERHIDVLCEPRLAPALHRHTANEAIAPLLSLTEVLDFHGRAEDLRQVDHQ